MVTANSKAIAIQNNLNATPLHWAVSKGHTRLAEAMAIANPDAITIENKDGNTNQPTTKRGHTEAFQTNNNANTTHQSTKKRGHIETLQNNRDREEQHSKKQNTNSR